MSGSDAVPDTEQLGAWDRLSLFVIRIPFGIKVAAVWLCLFAVLAFFFQIARFDTGWMADNAEFISGGLRYTATIAIGGIILAVLLALLGALARISSNAIAYGIAGFYVSFFRGTPLIVQIFLLYAAMPQVAGNLVDQVGWVPDNLDDLLLLEAAEVGIIALGLNYGAYMTEIFRAGIQSVAGGQGEAADALGMTYLQKMRKVVLPQAIRVIIPPTGNEFIAMMKDTALVAFVGVTVDQSEIFRRAQLLGRADNRPLEAYLLIAGMYWVLTIIFSYFQRKLEARISRGYVRTTTAKAKPGAGEIPENPIH